LVFIVLPRTTSKFQLSNSRFIAAISAKDALRAVATIATLSLALRKLALWGNENLN
jgi:hypothetical protein